LNESLAQTMFDTRNESGGGFESAARGVVHSMGPSDRFFSATVLGGRLHVRGVPGWGSWNSNRIDCFPQNQIVIVPEVGDRMIRTREELETIMREPTGATPTRNIWIHESLEDEGAARKPIHPVGESPTRGVAQLAAVVLSGV